MGKYPRVNKGMQEKHLYHLTVSYLACDKVMLLWTTVHGLSCINL